MALTHADYKKGIYAEYYRITGMWWAGIYNMLDPLREQISRKRKLEKLGCIHKWRDRFIVDDYVKITYHSKRYLTHKNARNCSRLIYDYLLIFDFVNAFRYIDEYIKVKYWNYKKFKRLKKNLNAFLKKIKEKLKDKEDIIVFWNDCVSYDELEWFPKLKQRAEKSYFFENAYTPTPFTTPAMFAMANKWMNIDDHEKYDVRDLSYSNCTLLQNVHKYGFEFKYFSEKDRHCVFAKELQRQNSREFISSCRLCFDAINELIMADKKQIMMVHFVTETHYPFWYPNKMGKSLEGLFTFDSVDLSDKCSSKYKQVYQAAQYWDEQLDFYSNLLGQGVSKIYMSDHGKYYQQQQYRHWLGKRHHIFFFIQSLYAPMIKEKQIFTLENFAELVESVMKAHQTRRELQLEAVFDLKYVRVQEADIYNEGLVNKYRKMHCEESAQAYRGIRTLDDYYLRFRDRELYYRNGDEETNLINDPKYADRIEELRALAGDYFIDIDKDEKFKYARELYH